MITLPNVIVRDVYASRPAAGAEGHLFFASDTGKIYRDNGSSWDDVTPSVASAGLNFADNETPSGTINGSNVTFTLAHSPNPTASLRLYKNGVLQVQGTHYTLSGGTITFVTAPESGDELVAFYRY